MSRINRSRVRRALLKEEADTRAEARASRSASQQIDVLDKRLGKGLGAKKERAKLAKALEKDK